MNSCMSAIQLVQQENRKQGQDVGVVTSSETMILVMIDVQLMPQIFSLILTVGVANAVASKGQVIGQCYACMAEIHIIKIYLIVFKVVRHSKLALSTSRMSKDISRMILEVDYCFHPTQIQRTQKENTNSRKHQDNTLSLKQAVDTVTSKGDKQMNSCRSVIEHVQEDNGKQLNSARSN